MRRFSLILGMMLAGMFVSGCSCLFGGTTDRYPIYFETCPGCREPWQPACMLGGKKCSTVAEKPAKCERPARVSCDRCTRTKVHRHCDPCGSVVYEAK
jgi:hypothetical protein